MIKMRPRNRSGKPVPREKLLKLNLASNLLSHVVVKLLLLMSRINLRRSMTLKRRLLRSQLVHRTRSLAKKWLIHEGIHESRQVAPLPVQTQSQTKRHSRQVAPSAQMLIVTLAFQTSRIPLAEGRLPLRGSQPSPVIGDTQGSQDTKMSAANLMKAKIVRDIMTTLTHQDIVAVGV